MARTVAQAEAELRTAALDRAEANEAYRKAYRRNGDHGRSDNVPLHPETQEKCILVTEKTFALHAATENLLGAVRAELRAEAL